MGTEGNLALGVNMQVKTLFAVRAVAVPHKEITFRHFTPRCGASQCDVTSVERGVSVQVVFMQKLALLALLETVANVYRQDCRIGMG